MRNPPPDPERVKFYYSTVGCEKRHKFKELMSEFQFDYSEAHMGPDAWCLTGRTGFSHQRIWRFDKQAELT